MDLDHKIQKPSWSYYRKHFKWLVQRYWKWDEKDQSDVSKKKTDSSVGVKEDRIKLERIRQARFYVMTTVTFLFRVIVLVSLSSFEYMKQRQNQKVVLTTPPVIIVKGCNTFLLYCFKYAECAEQCYSVRALMVIHLIVFQLSGWSYWLIRTLISSFAIIMTRTEISQWGPKTTKRGGDW